MDDITRSNLENLGSEDRDTQFNAFMNIIDATNQG